MVRKHMFMKVIKNLSNLLSRDLNFAKRSETLAQCRQFYDAKYPDATHFVNRKMKYIEIGANLSDRMYQGEYNGSNKHEADLPCVLERSWKAGIEYMIITGGSLSDVTEAINLSKIDERLFTTVGCHPTRCNEFLEPIAKSNNEKLSSNNEDSATQYMNALHELITANKDKVVAVGECGLDYDRTKFCPIEIQKKYFEQQLELSTSTNLPLFLHCRNAADDLAAILERNRDILPKRLGVVHSFDGTYEEAKRFIELGFHIGINGCSLRTEENLDVVRQIPVEKLMLETDAPWCEIKPTHASSKYLDKSNIIPSVKKEKWKAGSMVKGRNEPCNITQILDVVSALKLQEGESLNIFKQHIADTILESTKNIFFPNV